MFVYFKGYIKTENAKNVYITNIYYYQKLTIYVTKNQVGS